MAIVQISRITNRKGLTENLPQLAGAELGWCVDSRRLFIGNGTLEEGAPIIGNTEILTEFSDITVLSDYTYQDVAVGYAAQTGPTPSDPVVRTVQAKLDDFASVRDFGAVGDGAADDTEAINRALNQLYCRETNTQIRRTLYFPAGTYRVTESIIIPSYAKLVGEGSDCSIILLDISGDISSLSAYVARYGDSLQQTGANIGNNGATPPRHIEISGMTFQTNVVTDVFFVEDCSQCWFDSVGFAGPLTNNDIINNLSSDNIAGVRFSSSPGSISNTITFDKCRFIGLTYGMNTDDAVYSLTVSNSKLTNLYQGIVMGGGTPINGGPTGVRVQGNMFDDIYGEGVIYGNVTHNVTAYNIFFDVGNEFTTNPATPVIRFQNDNNCSISDQFERVTNDANLFPRVLITGTPTTTSTLIQLGRYARVSGKSFTVANNVSNQPVFETNATLIKAYVMSYTITRSTGIRHGEVTVASQLSDDSSLTLAYTEDYTENSDVGVTFSVTQVGTTVTMRYTSANTGNPGTLTYSLEHLA